MRTIFNLSLLLAFLLLLGSCKKTVIDTTPDFEKVIPGIFEGTRTYVGVALDTMIADIELSGAKEFTFKQRSESDTPPLVFKTKIVKVGGNGCFLTVPPQTYGGSKLEGVVLEEFKSEPTKVHGFYEEKDSKGMVLRNLVLQIKYNGITYLYVIKKVK